MAGRIQKPVRVFYCYAAVDELLRQKLETALANLRHQGWIIDWHPGLITAGEDFKRQIDAKFAEADLILFLVSPDFLSDDLCYRVQIPEAMRRHARSEARVVPIWLRPTELTDAPFAHLVGLPNPDQPITLAADHDAGWLAVAQGLRRIIAEMTGERAYLEPSRPTFDSRPSRSGWLNGILRRIRWMIAGIGILKIIETISLSQFNKGKIIIYFSITAAAGTVIVIVINTHRNSPTTIDDLSVASTITKTNVTRSVHTGPILEQIEESPPFLANPPPTRVVTNPPRSKGGVRPKRGPIQHKPPIITTPPSLPTITPQPVVNGPTLEVQNDQPNERKIRPCIMGIHINQESNSNLHRTIKNVITSDVSAHFHDAEYDPAKCNKISDPLSISVTLESGQSFSRSASSLSCYIRFDFLRNGQDPYSLDAKETAPHFPNAPKDGDYWIACTNAMNEMTKKLDKLRLIKR